MPTFTTAALESFFESRVEESVKSSLLATKNGRKDVNPSTNSRNGAPKHLYISPALYVTPVQTTIPRPCSTDPVSPSPYVVNHKRRGGGVEWKNVDRFELEDLRPEDGSGDLCEEVEGNSGIDSEVERRDEETVDDEGHENEIKRWEVVKNENGVEQSYSASFVSTPGEFFDAIDEFSDGSISNTPPQGSKFESELHATRLLLLGEIEKRRDVEENLAMICSQWEQIRSLLMCQTGLTLPKPVRDGMLLDNNGIDQFCQEFLVSKLVAEAVGRGEARAEAEEAAGTIIESKDQEISRLHDRVQYYETVNHEMSQRKFVDIVRRKQENKRVHRRWIWSITGLSIAVGITLLLLKPGEPTDASSLNPLTTLNSGTAEL